METTIRAHLYDAPVDIHNEREEDLIAKENAKQYKINPDGDYTQWMAGNEAETYEILFGKALEEYNLNQKRKDRRMTMPEYIENVKNDTRGRVKKEDKKKGITQRIGKATSYEMVMSVGNVKQKTDDRGYVIRNQDGSRCMPERIDPAINKKIQEKYWEGFQERNPNFKLYAVDYHGDEVFQDKTDKQYYSGTEHSHGRFVPIAGGYKKGLSVQSSVNKALTGMGFHDHYEPQPDGSRKWVCAYSAWTASEAKVMEEITKEFIPDIEIVHPCAGLGLESLTTEAYRATQDLNSTKINAQATTEWLDDSIATLQAKKEEMWSDIESIDSERFTKNRDLNGLTNRVNSLKDEEKDLESKLALVKVQAEANAKRTETLNNVENNLRSQFAEFEKECDKLQDEKNAVNDLNSVLMADVNKFALDSENALQRLAQATEAYNNQDNNKLMGEILRIAKMPNGSYASDEYEKRTASRHERVETQEQFAKEAVQEVNIPVQKHVQLTPFTPVYPTFLNDFDEIARQDAEKDSSDENTY